MPPHCAIAHGGRLRKRKNHRCTKRVGHFNEHRTSVGVDAYCRRAFFARALIFGDDTICLLIFAYATKFLLRSFFSLRAVAV